MPITTAAELHHHQYQHNNKSKTTPPWTLHISLSTSYFHLKWAWATACFQAPWPPVPAHCKVYSVSDNVDVDDDDMRKLLACNKRRNCLPTSACGVTAKYCCSSCSIQLSSCPSASSQFHCQETMPMIQPQLPLSQPLALGKKKGLKGFNCSFVVCPSVATSVFLVMCI